MERLHEHPPSPLIPLSHPLLRRKKLRVWIKRDDLLRLPLPESPWAFSGNKWRKLKYNLLAAKEKGAAGLLSYGGAYSNHLAALAAAGRLFGIRTIGVVRGELREPLNPTLAAARACGMELYPLTRRDYRQKENPALQEQLREHFGDYFAIPEGGTNGLALRGCRELGEEILAELSGKGPPDYVLLAAGTGGTAAGLIQAMPAGCTVQPYAVLKGDFLHKNIAALLESSAHCHWEVEHRAHLGGYAKHTSALIDFIRDFHHKYQLWLDPVYTGKLFFRFFQKIEKDAYPPGSRIVLIHTGGLQGIAGFNERFGDLIPNPT